MIIIHEALKKVQTSLNLSSLEKPAAPANASGTTENPSKRTQKPANYFMLFMTIVLIAVAGYMIYTQTILHSSQIKLIAHKITTPPVKQTPAVPLAKIIIPALPSSTVTDKNTPAPAALELVVQGTMSQNGSTVALINNKIYEVGDSMEGIKITKIDKDAMTILRDDKEEIINVRH